MLIKTFAKKKKKERKMGEKNEKSRKMHEKTFY